MEYFEPMVLQFVLLIFQDPASSTYALIERGGLLAGAIAAIYFQHKIYRYLVDKLEERHKEQMQWITTQYEGLVGAFLSRSDQDTKTIQELSHSLERKGFYGDRGDR